MSEDRFVRQYALVGKRARSNAADFPLDTLVKAVAGEASLAGNALQSRELMGLRGEHLSLLKLCATPISIAEIGAHLKVHLGVARVLVGDVLERGLIAMSDTTTSNDPLSVDSLERLLDDLKAL
jgi:Protein of unknown function (DUF742)